MKEQDELKELFTTFSLMLTVNEHALHLNRALEECRMMYEILIDAIINSQRGVIESRLIKPAQILEQSKISQANMPDDVSLTIPRSATYLNLRIVNIDIFIKGTILVYVLRIPLAINIDFNLYHVLPLPIRIKEIDTKYIFIQPKIEYLLMDTDKRYFSGLEVHEIYECKVLNRLKMCRQNKPLQLAHLEEICEAQMARPIRSIPPSCSQRIVELNHTLWQQLHENGYL